MEILLEKAHKTGDLLIAVRFSERQKNFCVEELKWWPKLEELDVLMAARMRVMEAQGKELKEKELSKLPF